MKQPNNQLSVFSAKPLMLLFFFTLLPNMASAQCPDNNHPHMIDLGLPSGTKWACCNVGAQKPEDIGGYYAWGETEEKDVYDLSTYIHCDGSVETMHDIGDDIAGTQYDVAHVKWGGSWRIPSRTLYQELIVNCRTEWGTSNNVEGTIFIGSNGNSIFIPSSEEIIGTRNSRYGDKFESWTSTLYPEERYAWTMRFVKEDGVHRGALDDRERGLTVRPVVAGSNQMLLQDGDLFTAETIEGVTLTYRVTSAAEYTCQVGGGDYDVRACDVNTTGTVTVPEVAKGFQVTTVGGYAFYGCSGLTQITLPETIQTIMYCAFQNCSGLTSFTIPSSVTSFYGNHQWNGCTGLTSIHIPAKVWTMGNHTFANCPNILEVTVDEKNPVFESPAGSHAIINKSKKSIVQGFKNTVIPEGITYIESAAFVGNEYNDIVLPKSFEGFYWDAFQHNDVRSITVAEGNTLFDSRNNCNALMETATDKLVKGCANTVIPSNTKVIGEFAFAYSDFFTNDYSSLKTVVLPEGVTKIENWAFGNCNDLEEVTIPSTVTEIMYNAFIGSDNMKTLILYAQNPPVLGSYAFNEAQNNNIILFVPSGCKAKYESAEEWNKFQNIVEMGIEPVDQGEIIDIGTELDENTNLDGNVVGDVYYCISSGDGSYDPEEGCVVVTKPTEDSAIDGKDIFGEDFKAGYTGFVFMVAPGKGSINVEAETTGNMVLKVRVGDNTPTQMEVDGKTKVSFSYDVSEPTFVFIYGSIGAAGAKGMRKVSGTDMLKIYGIEVTSETNGIEAIDNGQLTIDNSPVYNLNGQRVISSPSGRPGGVPTKGIYIQNSKKVLVK